MGPAERLSGQQLPHRNLQQFANDVEKASGGKLKIQLHPNAALFKAPEIKRAVQGGQAQAGEILLVNLRERGPAVRARRRALPRHSYADRVQAVQGVEEGARGQAREAGHAAALRRAWPPQGIYANRTLNSAADMKGLKWRAYSPPPRKIAELVGAQPVTVQAAEVSQALATGVIDSYMSSGATGYDSKTYEHIKNVLRHAGVAAEERDDRQPQGVRRARQAAQQALLKAAADAETRGWKLSEEKNGWYLDQLQPERHDDRQADRAAHGRPAQGRQLHAGRLAAKAGPDGKKVIDSFRTLQ
jgi:TRAP-type C4-dicarboxylate transport system substrate-binding protein